MTGSGRQIRRLKDVRALPPASSLLEGKLEREDFSCWRQSGHLQEARALPPASSLLEGDFSCWRQNRHLQDARVLPPASRVSVANLREGFQLLAAERAFAGCKSSAACFK